ncbi:hypothetical protein CRENPOLYSF2_4610002 [Crenothrix polyspora]|uniref:Uncharacterized protein n=2 Tax=Crenothrix polyspora TaxID=360316 RepID=A0A1R4HFY4_9GAMM|nr:hypothetical protein CRENPOLYSF2_4610002 [Crenothrix polyspora]
MINHCMPTRSVKEKNMPFFMAYKPIEVLFLPLLFSACFYGGDLWLLLNLPFGMTNLSLFLQAFLIIALAAPLVAFWAINRHGTFVIGADKKGIYYKKLDDIAQFVFISWDSINNLSINETGKRILTIETTYNKFKKNKLPIPCNGSVYFLKSGTICLEFNTCFSYKTAHILKNLNELRRDYSIKKYQINNT